MRATSPTPLLPDGQQTAESTVGREVVTVIERYGVTHAFCVPGESYLGILDAFNDSSAVDRPSPPTTKAGPGSWRMPARSCRADQGWSSKRAGLG